MMDAKRGKKKVKKVRKMLKKDDKKGRQKPSQEKKHFDIFKIKKRL